MENQLRNVSFVKAIEINETQLHKKIVFPNYTVASDDRDRMRKP